MEQTSSTSELDEGILGADILGLDEGVSMPEALIVAQHFAALEFRNESLELDSSIQNVVVIDHPNVSEIEKTEDKIASVYGVLFLNGAELDIVLAEIDLKGTEIKNAEDTIKLN